MGRAYLRGRKLLVAKKHDVEAGAPKAREGSQGPVNRRTALTALGAVGIGLAGTAAATAGRAKAGTQPSLTGSTSTGTTAACILTPEEVEGPYYLDYELVRRDITEGYPGLPLTLRLTVIDTSTCAPLPGAALDIWHCNAIGEYSGYTSLGIGGSGGSQPTPTATPTATPTGSPPAGGGGGHVNATDNLTFLRGVQLTDHHGTATFQTIYPGWYTGRAIHIHIMVHIGGRVTSARKYAGGHVSHTGQLYFPENISAKVANLEPYKINTVTRVQNTDDFIFTGGNDSGLLTLTPLQPRRRGSALEQGLLASIGLGVNPSAS
jgi:protocatechuate 3,4-dioxygenase beta subunit